MAQIIARWKKNNFGKKVRTYTVRIRKLGRQIVETFDNLDDARTWAGLTEAAIKQRKFKDPQSAMISLHDAFTSYHTYIEQKNLKKPSTIEREKSSMRRIEELLGPDTPLPEIDGDMIVELRDTRQLVDKVGASTIRGEMALISHLYKIAKSEWRLPLENPVTGITRPRLPQGRMRVLTLSEKADLFSEAKRSRNPRLYCYLLTLLQTGMRSSEAAGLKKTDVDLPGRIAVLRDTKNGTVRRVPLTETISREMQRLIDKLPGHYLFIEKSREKKMKDQPRPGALLFDAWDLCRLRAGLADVKLHDLRHTAATDMLAQGIEPRTLCAIFGWKNFQMVMRYTHPDDAQKRRAVDTLDAEDRRTGLVVVKKEKAAVKGGTPQPGETAVG